MSEIIKPSHHECFKLIEFDTERLRLRQWCEADREPFAALNADPRVMAFFPALLDRAASDAMMERCRSLIARRGWGLWVVETKEGGEFAGFVGLHIPAHPLPFMPCVEVGWRLAYRHWGKGYATEAAREAIRVGFELLGLSEIVSFASVQHIKSRAVMMRLGMLETGEFFEHPAIAEGHPLSRHCLYRLSREQWSAAKL